MKLNLDQVEGSDVQYLNEKTSAKVIETTPGKVLIESGHVSPPRKTSHVNIPAGSGSEPRHLRANLSTARLRRLS